TKHIQQKYHYVQDNVVVSGKAMVCYCKGTYVPTADMVADFTKALMREEKHWKFVRAMGLWQCSSGSVK
ncbi:hypothetical protein K439DRAFT_1270695, partial [Ramaria rubella]